MRNVKLNKSELLNIVKQNRESHRKVFLEAVEGYRAEVIRTLTQRLEEAKSGRRVSHFISLVQPIDQTKEYDRVIRMLELSIDETIDLTEQDFACYVQDDWAWKRNFLTANSAYSVSAKSLLEDQPEED